MDFENKKISELNIELIDGDRGKNYPKNSEIKGKGFCLFLNAKNVTSNDFNFNELNYISEEKDKLLRNGKIKRKDIILTTRGTVGNVAYYSNKIPYENMRINSGMIIIRCSENLNEKYLYWYMKSKMFQNQIKELQTGSAQPQLPISIIKNMNIKLCEKHLQNKIVKVLDIIQQKIDLNAHTNNNLYAMGKALYQEYFENEKYMSNYETKQLSDVTTNNRNKIDQNKEYKVLSAVNTGNLVLSDDYFDKQVYSKDIGKYLNVNKYDFAYNPARINIGSIGLNTFDFNCCVSPVYVTFSVDKDYIDFFDFYFKSKKFNAEVTLRASGSVRQALNYNDFGMIEIPYPTKEMIDKFNNSYKTLKERININKVKIRNLEQIRDTLLPKLMNGEIDLDKVEI